MNKTLLISVILFVMIVKASQAQPHAKYNLKFDHLAKRWDEAIPLGNGMLGALVRQEAGKLRLSLGRADLWDERKAIVIKPFKHQMEKVLF